MEPEKPMFVCSCGRSIVFSWRQPPACQGCGWCGTNLASSPALCAQAIAHDLYQEDCILEGGIEVTMRICKHCNLMSPLFNSERVPTLATIT